jgi:hypothetical protein
MESIEDKKRRISKHQELPSSTRNCLCCSVKHQLLVALWANKFAGEGNGLTRSEVENLLRLVGVKNLECELSMCESQRNGTLSEEKTDGGVSRERDRGSEGFPTRHRQISSSFEDAGERWISAMR